MRILVLGGGAQGSACAFDLVRSPEVSRVVVADLRPERPREFLVPWLGEGLEFRAVDARDGDALRSLAGGFDAVACALPWQLNVAAARAALAAGAHYCDLGGHTASVDRQRELDDEARARGVSIVPDCGLAPGLVNVLARAGIENLDETDSVRILVGGLPRYPKPPLNYTVAYSLEGVLDYYTTPVLMLEEGRVVEQEALTSVETVEVEGVGTLEAFLTAGGISRMPYAYEGRIRSMTYKTLRYPGHAALMRAIRELGLLEETPVEVDGCRVRPREVFIRTVGPRIGAAEDEEDLVALRVVVEGTRNGRPERIRWDLLDRFDAEHGITAMMRATGYSLAAVARLQAAGRIEPGVRTADEGVPARPYLEALAERGVRVRRTEG